MSLSNADFLRRVHEYLPTEALSQEIDGDGKATGDNLSGRLSANTFYVLNGEALVSITHAIEDHALEEANGSLLAAFAEPRHLEQNRDRYWQLGATLADVEIITRGKAPRRHGSLKFCDAKRTALKDFWMVLYQGRRTHVGLVCQRIEAAHELEEQRFVGFYTFEAALIARVREDIVDLLGGRCPDLKEFQRLRAIDRAAKHLKTEFARENATLDAALRKLKAGGSRYQPNHFAQDLAKCIERLRQWEVRIPEMLALPRHKHD